MHNRIKSDPEKSLALFDALREEFSRLQKEVAVSGEMAQAVPIQDIAARIREERKIQQLSQRDLAALAEVSLAAIVKLERGDLGVTLTTLTRVTGALGIQLMVV